jgi:L-ascorbate metabolism protein UlaG (beta-lactamase superfamily)
VRAAVTATRIGHSTVLLDFDGAVVLTDPWFTERAMDHRGEPLAADVANLPHLAGALVSHGHYDHCDLAAFAAYQDKTVPFLVKRGLGGRVRAAGLGSVTELDA